VNFLGAHGISCLYLSGLLFILGREMILGHALLQKNFSNGASGQEVENTYMAVIWSIYTQHWYLLSMFGSSLVVGVVLITCWLWQIYLVASNQTSIERRNSKRFKTGSHCLPGVEVYNNGLCRNIMEGFFCCEVPVKVKNE